MKYYEKNAKEYIASTIDTDMSESYKMVEKYLPSDASILDVGFGSGRDMIFFQKKGFKVFGIDACEGFIKHAKEMGFRVENADIRTFETNDRYDLIWCCASLLHLKKNEVLPAIMKYLGFLNEDGILFISMKYSNKPDGYDENGRYFTYFNNDDIDRLKQYTKEISFSKDSKRDEVTWINLILKNAE